MEIKKIIDLSVTVYTYMPAGSMSPLTELKPIGILPREGYSYETLFSGTHTGTHVDAPYHFSESGLTIDRLDLRSMIGEGYCIEVIPKGKEITRAELESKWSSEFDGKILLLNTGWSKRRGFTKEFFYDYPGLSSDTCDFLLAHRVNTVGIDSLGIEPQGRTEVHKILLEKGLVFVEDMTNLESLEKGKKYFIIILPVKLLNAGGAMARAVALDVF